MKVIKRDGRVVNFESSFIKNAINSAYGNINTDSGAEKACDEVLSWARGLGKEMVAVEIIQDKIENVLMKIDSVVARGFIKHRTERDRIREMKGDLFNSVDSLFSNNNPEVTLENSNKASETISTQRDLLAGIVSKEYALKYLLPKNVADAHRDGLIHVHDLDYSPMFGSYNCQLLGYEKMLRDGFTLGGVEIETPKSIRTACTVLTQIMASVASASYGGLSANNIDIVLAPYVKKSYQTYLKEAIEEGHNNPSDYAERKTTKEVYDSFQCLEYQVNTLSTTNGQAPFSTLGFGLGTSWEEKLIQKTILEVRIKGIGKRCKTPTFPKLCFVLKDGLNLKKTDPNYDIKQLAMECQRKRIYPDLLNYEQVVDITGSFKSPMGRR